MSTQCTALNGIDDSFELNDPAVVIVNGKPMRRCTQSGFIEVPKGSGNYYCRPHADVLRNFMAGKDPRRSSPAFNVDTRYAGGIVVPGRHLPVTPGRPTADRCVKNGRII